MSAAMVFLSYPSAGASLAPAPRRSGAITVYCLASSGSSSRHSYQLSGYPCSNTSVGPFPPRT